MTTALYPGAFDPVTMGHVDIATRAAALFDKVMVGVYSRPDKSLLFSIEERVDMAKKALEHLPNVEVRDYTTLTVDFARKLGAQVTIRGLRTGSDFEYEFEMAYMNKKLAPDVESVFMMSSLEYQFVSSSSLREVTTLGGDISGLVPPHVLKALAEKLG
jgi:pantetheine-phosphate adenylyltransferase